jgi:putative DNA primase/helicase
MKSRAARAGKSRKLNKPRLDFSAVNAAAVSALPAVVVQWLPNGHREGHEWCVGSLRGEAGRSLKINLRTGKWCDFAEGVGGRDPVALAAALFNMSQGKACRAVAEMLGVAHV